ncbi:MAG: hypothetical protein HXY20_07820, partial [Acidobacteria bacterium]|nr:hypothetical protein [Acidobacteriota bacterium]
MALRLRLASKILILLSLVIAAAAAVLTTRRVGVQLDGSIVIPTGQMLTPAGTHIEVSDRPLGMVVSPDGRLLAVATGSNFAPRSLHLIDTAARSMFQTIPIGDSFVGVAFDRTGGSLYVGGGRDNDVKILERQADGTFRQTRSIRIPGSAPSGLALSADGRTLYAALNLKHSVAAIDLASGRFDEIEVGSYPYSVIASHRVYV